MFSIHRASADLSSSSGQVHSSTSQSSNHRSQNELCGEPAKLLIMNNNNNANVESCNEQVRPIRKIPKSKFAIFGGRVSFGGISSSSHQQHEDSTRGRKLVNDIVNRFQNNRLFEHHNKNSVPTNSLNHHEFDDEYTTGHDDDEERGENLNGGLKPMESSSSRNTNSKDIKLSKQHQPTTNHLEIDQVDFARQISDDCDDDRLMFRSTAKEAASYKNDDDEKNQHSNMKLKSRQRQPSSSDNFFGRSQTTTSRNNDFSSPPSSYSAAATPTHIEHQQRHLLHHHHHQSSTICEDEQTAFHDAKRRSSSYLYGVGDKKNNNNDENKIIFDECCGDDHNDNDKENASSSNASVENVDLSVKSKNKLNNNLPNLLHSSSGYSSSGSSGERGTNNEEPVVDGGRQTVPVAVNRNLPNLPKSSPRLACTDQIYSGLQALNNLADVVRDNEHHNSRLLPQHNSSVNNNNRVPKKPPRGKSAPEINSQQDHHSSTHRLNSTAMKLKHFLFHQQSSNKGNSNDIVKSNINESSKKLKNNNLFGGGVQEKTHDIIISKPHLTSSTSKAVMSNDNNHIPTYPEPNSNGAPNGNGYMYDHRMEKVGALVQHKRRSRKNSEDDDDFEEYLDDEDSFENHHNDNMSSSYLQSPVNTNSLVGDESAGSSPPPASTPSYERQDITASSTRDCHPPSDVALATPPPPDMFRDHTETDGSSHSGRQGGGASTVNEHVNKKRSLSSPNKVLQAVKTGHGGHHNGELEEQKATIQIQNINHYNVPSKIRNPFKTTINTANDTIQYRMCNGGSTHSGRHALDALRSSSSNVTATTSDSGFQTTRTHTPTTNERQPSAAHPNSKLVEVAEDYYKVPRSLNTSTVINRRCSVGDNVNGKQQQDENIYAYPNTIHRSTYGRTGGSNNYVGPTVDPPSDSDRSSVSFFKSNSRARNVHASNNNIMNSANLVKHAFNDGKNNMSKREFDREGRAIQAGGTLSRRTRPQHGGGHRTYSVCSTSPEPETSPENRRMPGHPRYHHMNGGGDLVNHSSNSRLNASSNNIAYRKSYYNDEIQQHTDASPVRPPRSRSSPAKDLPTAASSSMMPRVVRRVSSRQRSNGRGGGNDVPVVGGRGEDDRLAKFTEYRGENNGTRYEQQNNGRYNQNNRVVRQPTTIRTNPQYLGPSSLLTSRHATSTTSLLPQNNQKATTLRRRDSRSIDGNNNFGEKQHVLVQQKETAHGVDNNPMDYNGEMLDDNNDIINRGQSLPPKASMANIRKFYTPNGQDHHQEEEEEDIYDLTPDQQQMQDNKQSRSPHPALTADANRNRQFMSPALSSASRRTTDRQSMISESRVAESSVMPFSETVDSEASELESAATLAQRRRHRQMHQQRSNNVLRGVRTSPKRYAPQPPSLPTGMSTSAVRSKAIGGDERRIDRSPPPSMYRAQPSSSQSMASTSRLNVMESDRRSNGNRTSPMVISRNQSRREDPRHKNEDNLKSTSIQDIRSNVSQHNGSSSSILRHAPSVPHSINDPMQQHHTPSSMNGGSSSNRYNASSSRTTTGSGGLHRGMSPSRRSTSRGSLVPASHQGSNNDKRNYGINRHVNETQQQVSSRTRSSPALSRASSRQQGTQQDMKDKNVFVHDVCVADIPSQGGAPGQQQSTGGGVSSNRSTTARSTSADSKGYNTRSTQGQRNRTPSSTSGNVMSAATTQQPSFARPISNKSKPLSRSISMLSSAAVGAASAPWKRNATVIRVSNNNPPPTREIHYNNHNVYSQNHGGIAKFGGSSASRSSVIPPPPTNGIRRGIQRTNTTVGGGLSSSAAKLSPNMTRRSGGNGVNSGQTSLSPQIVSSKDLQAMQVKANAESQVLQSQLIERGGVKREPSDNVGNSNSPYSVSRSISMPQNHHRNNNDDLKNGGGGKRLAGWWKRNPKLVT